jgi:Cys-tRNA(Pro) deacylase
MAKHKTPVTPAIRALRAAGVAFVPREYEYVDKGGTRHSSAELGVPEHHVIKTLVMQTETGAPLVVLMHGDRQVSTKALARQLEVKRIDPCTPAIASKHTGYLVGGTSPFGTRTALPVYLERTIADLDTIYINGGKRGLLVEIAAAAVVQVLSPTLVDAATEG